MTRPKLSPAQQSLYDNIKECGYMPCSNGYAPAQKLVKLGLAYFERGRFGGYLLYFKKEETDDQESDPA